MAIKKDSRLIKRKNNMAAKKQLTQRQKDTLKRHSVHHTSKHMAEMRKLMKSGKTFTASHKIAMKKVGK
tara:strand:+ start:301 stop:507 length:207 start_codon:yes stop_codon:yes gene_type:complete